MRMSNRSGGISSGKVKLGYEMENGEKAAIVLCVCVCINKGQSSEASWSISNWVKASRQRDKWL